MLSLKKSLIFACVIGTLSAKAQKDYGWPIDFLEISGNYGEIRPNHFHAGIDFSTQKEQNFPIYAAADGYVSRVKISPYGYGKALYLTHPNGTTTVYGHQNKFNTRLAAYVKEQQYLKKSFEIELFLKPDQFPVKKGELIGYSGNTGGSTGPHLHFEIRDEKTEVPLNPLLYYKYLDTVKPVVNTIYIYDLSDPLEPVMMRTIAVKKKQGQLHLQNDSLNLDFSRIGIAFNGDDMDRPRGNPNNIYEVEIKADRQEIYHHQLNGISFDEARYVNIYADIINKQKVQKCFTPKLYPPAMYKKLVNHGIVELTDTLYHQAELHFTDENHNTTVLNFHFRTNHFKSKTEHPVNDRYVDCEKDFSFHIGNATFSIPAKTLFDDTELRPKNESAESVYIGAGRTEFREAGSVSFLLPEKFKAIASKVVLLCNSALSTPSASGESNTYSFKSFGEFRLKADTTGPVIKTRIPLTKLKTQIKKAGQLSFSIEDNLSGIKEYAVYINDAWVLAEYDAKADQLTYYFEEATPKGALDIRVEAADRVGNRSVYRLKLTR